MNILDALTKIKDDGFKPNESRINAPDRLDAGRYPVRLVSAEQDVIFETQPVVAFQLEVVSGENAKRREFISLSFEPDVPEFVLDKNAKILWTIADLVGVTLTESALQDYEALADAMKKGIGKQFIMELTLSPNKKNPQYPYRNYEFASLDEDIGENPFETDEITEEDLPF